MPWVHPEMWDEMREAITQIAAKDARIEELEARAERENGSKLMDLVGFIRRQITWSTKTFGAPHEREHGVVDHIRKELAEIESAPDDVGEWVDVVILALDGAWRTGATAEDVCAALQAKQVKNEQRVWPDWRTAEPGKAIEHVRALVEASEGGRDGRQRTNEG